MLIFISLHVFSKQEDLADKLPEIKDELITNLKNWLAEVEAELPDKNLQSNNSYSGKNRIAI